MIQGTYTIVFVGAKSEFVQGLDDYIRQIEGFSTVIVDNPEDALEDAMQGSLLFVSMISAFWRPYMEMIKQFRKEDKDTPVIAYIGDNPELNDSDFGDIDRIEVISGKGAYAEINEKMMRHLHIIPKEKIVVVEDEPDMLDMLAIRLRFASYEVLPLGDGEDFVSKIRDFSPDVILLDVMLPGISGLELCDMLKKHEDLEDIPVIFLTAKQDQNTKIEAFKKGAIDYITKPFNFYELLARVKAMIKIRHSQQRLLQMSTKDSLTGLNNRRTLLDYAHREVKSAMRYKYPLTCLMLDLDHFKHINDTYGHLVGDAVLRDVAHLFLKTLREVDIAGRYGGEEFLCLLPHTTKHKGFFCAERIAASIKDYHYSSHGKDIKVTVSIGVSESFEDSAYSVEELIERADLALYKAKNNGRNRVELYEG